MDGGAETVAVRVEIVQDEIGRPVPAESADGTPVRGGFGGARDQVLRRGGAHHEALLGDAHFGLSASGRAVQPQCAEGGEVEPAVQVTDPYGPVQAAP